MKHKRNEQQSTPFVSRLLDFARALGHWVTVVATGQGDDPNFWATTVGRRDVKVTLAATLLQCFFWGGCGR